MCERHAEPLSNASLSLFLSLSLQSRSARCVGSRKVSVAPDPLGGVGTGVAHGVGHGA